MSVDLEIRELLSSSDSDWLPRGSIVSFRLNNDEQKLLLAKSEAGKWEVMNNGDEASAALTVAGPEAKVKALLQGTDEGAKATEAGEVIVTVNPLLAGSGIVSEEVTFRGRVYSASLSIAVRDVSDLFMCGETEEMAKSYRVFGLMPFQDLTRDHATAQEMFDAFRAYHFIRSCTSVLIDAYFHRLQIELKTRIDRLRIFGQTILIARWILGVRGW